MPSFIARTVSPSLMTCLSSLTAEAPLPNGVAFPDHDQIPDDAEDRGQGWQDAQEGAEDRAGSR
jgi:hypothetical protein